MSQSTSAVSRSIFDLNTPRALAIARVLVPFLSGLYCLWLGADSNWDLYNYHMYNAFAWLHSKLRTDLAPAGIQSYFNPLLDVFFYLANTHLPGRWVGFLMGALHGLSFVFILGIAQRVLPDLSARDRYRVPLLLALAGCLTANFLSGLGNSMGDDSTALFSEAGLFVLLSNWRRLDLCSASAVVRTMAAGLIVGLGTGLKLTNAVYVIAMCAALLCYPARVAVRLRIAFLFGIGALAGWIITGGYWMYHMWDLFGNPLYPQFGALFPDPLVRPDAMGDARWRPHDWFEIVFWPFIFTLNSHRVGEVSIRQLIWPIVYLLFAWWAATRIARKILRRGAVTALDPRARFVVFFVGIGYVVWMALFSIYRYIVAIEVLTPLIVWILLHQLLPGRRARRVAGWALGVSTVVVMAGGARTWGHEGWSDPVWHAQVPAIAQPARTTAIIATTRAWPWTWLATFFPDEMAFMQIESSFPGTPAFGERMMETARQRGGPIYAISDAEYDWRADNIATMNRMANRLTLTDSERGCGMMRWTIAKLRLHASVRSAGNGGQVCELTLRQDDVRDIPAENRAILELAAPMFERHGFELDQASCRPYRSGIGRGVTMYQWCGVRVADAR